MKKANFLASACRFCRFYKPEGRRGGSCQKLSVPVESSWKACSLCSLPFNQEWESLEEIPLLVLGNKNDLDNCFTEEELIEKMNL